MSTTARPQQHQNANNSIECIENRRDVSHIRDVKIKGILKIAETPGRDRMSTIAGSGERPTTALY
jgi:hypothetical protein